MQKYERTRYQIIDTPGLLDRPFEKRNDIEKQAIAALRYLADIILFVLDPSETCGYSLKEQKNLLTELKKMFKEQTFIIIENKSDIKKSKTKNLKISCIKDVDTKKLMEKIYSIELKK